MHYKSVNDQLHYKLQSSFTSVFPLHLALVCCSLFGPTKYAKTIHKTTTVVNTTAENGTQDFGLTRDSYSHFLTIYLEKPLSLEALI